MGPRCSSAETQVCHRSYIIAATTNGSLLFFNMATNDKNETIVIQTIILIKGVVFPRALAQGKQPLEG
jgi:hypothetical protein